MGRTTVEVRDETWERLNNKKSRGDTFDDVITQLLDAEEAAGADVGEAVTPAEAGGSAPFEAGDSS